MEPRVLLWLVLVQLHTELIVQGEGYVNHISAWLTSLKAKSVFMKNITVIVWIVV